MQTDRTRRTMKRTCATISTVSVTTTETRSINECDDSNRKRARNNKAAANAVVDDDGTLTPCSGSISACPTNDEGSTNATHMILSPVRSARPTKKKICCKTHGTCGGSNCTSASSLAPPLSSADNNIPSSFVCPLTMEVMIDPVLDTEGNSYERSAICQWLRQSRTSPLSRQPLTERMLVPNVALKSAIHEVMGDAWVKEQQSQQQQQASLVDDSSRMSVPSNAGGNSGSRHVVADVAANSSTPGLHQHHSFRTKIDCFLQHTCRELGGLQLRLNEDGCCAFRYERITVVLDVPATAGVFCLYTKHLVDLDPAQPHRNDFLCRRALALNFLQGDTRGGCLSIRSKVLSNEDEIMFSYTDRVPEISARDFSNILLNFVETSVLLREKLLKSPLARAL